MAAEGNTEQPPIEDYGFIGDCRTAALVSRAGSIDWLCLPNFDSPAIFARLLDEASGGCFSIRPHAPFTCTRQYIGPTCVLETTFEAASRRGRIVDLMPIVDGARTLQPMREVLRIIEGGTWWFGALGGCVHGMFLLVVALPLLPFVHPRMASEYHDATATRQLEPPGFLAMNYGYQTPLTTLLGQDRLRRDARRFPAAAPGDGQLISAA